MKRSVLSAPRSPLKPSRGGRSIKSLIAPSPNPARGGKVETQNWPWPNFTQTEMSCRHCAETYYWSAFMHALQAARDDIEQPFRILSAHRCSLHNARVGGAPRSQHLRLAVDIALIGHDRHALLTALRRAGFTGFGFYTTFIHADMGRPRQWFGTPIARQQWQLD